MMPVYMIIVFDEALPAVPSNARWKYLDKRTWLSLADSDVIDQLELDELKYQIVRRRSYRLDDLTGARMVLQMDVKKLTE